MEAVTTQTLEDTPPDATHGVYPVHVPHVGLSQTAVSRIGRARGLPPHRTGSFKRSTDPFFVDKVRPTWCACIWTLRSAPSSCAWTRRPMQVLNRVQPIFPLLPGTPERRSHDVARHGRTSLFAALPGDTGDVVGSLRRHHRTQEFKQFLTQLDTTAPPELAVHRVLDYDATHKSPPL